MGPSLYGRKADGPPDSDKALKRPLAEQILFGDLAEHGGTAALKAFRR